MSVSALLELAVGVGFLLLAAGVAAIAAPFVVAIWSGIVEELPELPFIPLDAVEPDAVTVLKLEGYLRPDWQWPNADTDDATRVAREDELTAAHHAWRCDAEKRPPAPRENWP